MMTAFFFLKENFRRECKRLKGTEGSLRLEHNKDKWGAANAELSVLYFKVDPKHLRIIAL